MKVVLSSASYWPVLGGLQTITQALACDMSQHGHTVQVVTQRYPRTLPPFERVDGIPVHRWLFLAPDGALIRRGRWDLWLAGLYAAPAIRLQFSRLMTQFRPEVVNVHFPDAQSPFVLRLREQYPFRLVVSLHGDEIERWATNGIERSGDKRHLDVQELQRLRQILQKADSVIACSRYLLDEAIKLEPSIAGKSTVIHNGVDLQRFRDQQAYQRPRRYVFAFGRLTYKKGFDLLVEAFARVAPAFPAVDLLIAGDGEERHTLAHQVSALNLAERVQFWGQATPEDVVQLLKGCEFVVVPSRREPFGIVVLEAMAAGKAVLATNVGGLPEILAGSANYSVSVSVTSLAEAMREWCHHPAEVREIGRSNLTREADFGWPGALQSYRQCICG